MSNKNYHLKQTWDTKYNETNFEKYEWIESEMAAFNLLKPYLPEDKQCQILQLGSGTSHLSQIIQKAGYKNVTCIDFSKRLIKKRQKNQELKYIFADFTQKWNFQSETKYDLVIDKGSLDCVFCDDNYLKRVLTCMNECYKRLNSGGKFISFSLGLPKNRVYWFRNKLAPFESVEVKKQVNRLRQEMRKKGKNYNKDKEENSEDYFVYICRKGLSQDGNECENNMDGINFDNEQNKEEEENNVQEQHKQQSEQNQQDENDEQSHQEHNQQQKQQQTNEQQMMDDENQQLKQQNKEEEQNYENQFDEVNDQS